MKVAQTVGELSRSTKYNQQLALIKTCISRSGSGKSSFRTKESLEDEPEYKLLIESNKLNQDIDEEIIHTHRYANDIYHKKFPELESLVPNKVDLIKTIKLIGNETDITLVNGLNDILANSIVMIISVTASTTSGEALSSTELAECFKACDEVLRLEEDKKFIISFVESRMQFIAPNLSTIIGTSVAAQLVGLAGGLTALAKIPACNIQVMGQERKNLGGMSFSSQVHVPHVGNIVEERRGEYSRIE